jgi:AraC family transcriptional regulator of adaptative response/methylated-DNA-[protein]-cysteine methyltransferase
MKTACANYQLVEKAIQYLHAEFPRQVNLDELAEKVHLSPFHFQRIFTEWAGVSPKKYLQYLTLNYAKSQLAKAPNLAEASETAGLSGSGRLHDLFVNLEGITPGEYKTQGEQVEIHYGIYESPFGRALLAVTKRGICKLAFTENPEAAITELKLEWPKAFISKNSEATYQYFRQLFPAANNQKAKQNIFLKGTPFQLKVWEALLRIPEGALVTYSTIAEAIGMPKAVRAVGTAIGQNPIAYFIPCHRVIRKAGGWGDYRWGLARKLALIGWEASKQPVAIPEQLELL